jgi:PAS domain S-box-containing protein
MANELTKHAHESWTREGSVPDRLNLPETSFATVPSSGMGECPEPVDGSRSPSEKPRLSLSEALDLLHVETSRRQLAEQGLRESEERFRQMSQYLGKFVWLSDAESKELIYVSPGYERVWYRYREASYALPQDWLNATPPGGGSRIHGQAGAQVSENKEKTDYQIAGPDGSLRWIRDRMLPIRDSSGQTLYTLGIAEDITEVKALQESWRKSELKSHALMNAIPDMVFRLNRDGAILEFKPAKDSLVLTPSIDLVGKNLNDLLPTQVAEQAMHYLELTFQTGHLQTFTCQYLLPDYLRDF